MPIDCSEMSRLVSEIALAHGSDPSVKNLDDVTERMGKDFPGLTREEIANSIVEAHTSGPREISELEKKLTALKAEARRTAPTNILQRMKGQIEKASGPGETKATTRQPATPAQTRERIIKQIADLTTQLSQTRVQAQQQKAQAAPLTGEIERLAYQRDRLRGQIRERIDALKPTTVWGKVTTVGAESLNVPRSIMASGDFSAVGRQGGFIVLGNPGRAAKAIVPMLRASVSPVKAHAINEEILNRPNAPLYARSKLYLAPVEGGGKLAAREEQFMSRLVEKLPKWTLVGPLVRGSDRAYSIFLNRLRADSFDAMTATLGRNGAVTQPEATAIANYINKATGRGGLGPAEGAASFFSSVLWSPRNLVSRFQLLAGEPLYGGTARTRTLIARDYGKFLVGVGLTYALGSLAGGSVDWDPRSSDFGKIRFGNTRLDPLSGLAQVARFVAQLTTGQKKSAAGRVEHLGGAKHKFADPTYSDVIKDFARTKLAPTPGTLLDLAEGKNVVGQPVTPGSAAKNLFTPMVANDIVKAIQDQGVSKGSALGLLSIFGVGVQSYQSVSELKKLRAEDQQRRESEPKGMPHLKNPRLQMLEDQERLKKSLVP